MHIFTQCKVLLPAVVAALLVPGYAQSTPASPFKVLSVTNLTSPLPPGWSNFFCFDDCDFELLFGPAISDPIHMTIEACVEFCDAQGSRLAGLRGSQCRCANIFNPNTCFESEIGVCQDPQQVGLGCPGNRQESCGSDGTATGRPLLNIFFKSSFTQFSCLRPEWEGGAPLTAIGSWRFSFFYNDSETAHALSQNAADLANPPPLNNLTTVACVTACNNAGFTLTGLKAGKQCFCGNSISNGASPVKDCLEITTATLTPCSGNDREFCGGTDVISVYTLPGTGLVPMVAFDSGLDNLCSFGDCPGPV